MGNSGKLGIEPIASRSNRPTRGHHNRALLYIETKSFVLFMAKPVPSKGVKHLINRSINNPLIPTHTHIWLALILDSALRRKHIALFTWHGFIVAPWIFCWVKQTCRVARELFSNSRSPLRTHFKCASHHHLTLDESLPDGALSLPNHTRQTQCQLIVC